MLFFFLRRDCSALGLVPPSKESLFPPFRKMVRSMYHSLHLDPTRDRPSSEKLLRRFNRDGYLPRIDPIVDLWNDWSLVSGLPLSLLDADTVTPPLSLRLGSEGLTYPVSGMDAFPLAGRPVLFDARGPLGNPTRDSLRGLARPQSSRFLVLIYRPRDTEAEPPPLPDLPSGLYALPVSTPEHPDLR